MNVLGPIKKFDQHTAEVFHFVFDGGCCWWATFTIIEALGEFSIISDCGNYSHRWPAMGLDGDPLKDFLATCHPGYVIEKFSYSNKTDLEPQVDYESTRKEFRKAVGEHYQACRNSFRRKHVSKNDIRDLLREVDDLLEDDPPTTLLCERLSGELWNALGDEPWELICHQPSPRAKALSDHLLPFFFNWLKEQGYGSRRSRSAS